MLSQRTKIEPSQNTTKQTQRQVLELTKMIGQQNNQQILSTYFTNRGVLYYQLGNYEWAQADFERAVSLNHLNYAAYFNIFSICFTENNLVEGVNNLCCALSCLYLIRGRCRNNESDISKCVKLAENNHEGRLLRALQYTKKQKYSLAMNQIKWILQAEPNNKQIKQLKFFLNSIISKSGTRITYQQSNSQQNQVVESSTQKRLICTLYDNLDQNQQLDYFIQAQKKLSQFNQLYSDLNLTRTTKHQGYFYNIFLLKNPFKTANSSQISSPISRQQSLKDKSYQNNEYQITTSPPKMSQKTSSQQFRIANSVQFQAGSADSQVLSSQVSHQEAKNLQGSSSMQQPMLFGSMTKKSSKSRSGISGTNSNYQTNSFITVTAQDQQEKLHIRIQEIKITNLSAFQLAKLQSLYCLFQYTQNQQLLLKSNSSLTYDKQAQQSQSKRLVVKVYNKQILAFNDRFLGAGQTQITKSGFYTIVIHLDKNQVNQAGSVDLLIDII